MIAIDCLPHQLGRLEWDPRLEAEVIAATDGSHQWPLMAADGHWLPPRMVMATGCRRGWPLMTTDGSSSSHPRT